MIGRTLERTLLDNLYHGEKSSLVVVYGRRRIGKSFLIHNHVSKRPCLHFEGVEGESSRYHIALLCQEIRSQLKAAPTTGSSTWEDALTLVTEYLKVSRKQRVIIFFDEYQWIASGRSKLTSLIKKYWDNQWKKMNVQLILCGSISSYMVKKVIKSKALYGRIDAEINVRQLIPQEAHLFFRKDQSDLERLKYLLIFGGVPKYLEDINQSLSFEKNLARLFFDRNSTYINEYEKIFYSQFRKYKTYENIISILAKQPLTLKEISDKISFPSGGGLKSYLDNLVGAQFIKGIYSSSDKLKSKILTYKIIDPFLKFYLFFVFPHRKLILESRDSVSLQRKITKNKLNIFLGHALENFCQFFALDLAKLMNFEDEVLSYGPFYGRSGDGKSENGFQIDLLYFRENKHLTVCEMKYSEELISPEVIPEVENKVYKLKKLYPQHSMQRVLITTIGPNKALRDSNYFDSILSAKNLLKA